jgi:hypothetical protein
VQACLDAAKTRGQKLNLVSQLNILGQNNVTATLQLGLKVFSDRADFGSKIFTHGVGLLDEFRKNPRGLASLLELEGHSALGILDPFFQQLPSLLGPLEKGAGLKVLSLQVFAHPLSDASVKIEKVLTGHLTPRVLDHGRDRGRSGDKGLTTRGVMG